MANIPDNIVAILGVDNAGAITNIDPNLVFNKQELSTSSGVTVSTTPTKETKPQQVVVTNNVETTVAFEIDASSNNIAMVNNTQDNLEDSIIWQFANKVGIGTKSPRWTVDVKGGSVNITPVLGSDGYKIKDVNFAYADFSISGSEQIVMGDDLLLPITNINDLIIRGLIPVTATGKDRILFINDLGVVSAKTDIFLESINGLTNKVQVFAFGTSGTSPNVVSTVISTVGTHTFNFPLASAAGVTAGLISKTDYDTFTARVSGSGTVNYIPKFTATSAIGDSALQDNGTLITLGRNTSIIGTLQGSSTASFTSSVTANSFVKISGTSSQYLMADGSVSTITDAFVTGKLLTGYTTLTGTVSSTDTILQAFGRVQAQLNALSGSLIYKGSWNASTNSPTIVSGTGTNGNYYIVSVAGTTTIDGISSWAVGDWIVFNSTTGTWQKIANQSVTSVNGITGAVTITTSDIAEGINLYYTNARAIASTLTGYVSGAGTITSSDTILSAIQKLNGNIAVLVTGVSSVFGRPGAVVAASGDYTTNLVTEGTNLYYTQARFDAAFIAKSTTDLSEGTNLYFTTDRARTAIATPSAPLSYNSTTGVFSISQATTTTDGYLSSANWNTFNNKQNALTFGNLTESTSSVLIITGGTGAVIGAGTTIQVKQAGSTQSGFLTTTDWNTFNNKVPAARTLTINGVTYDLSADRTWTITAGTIGGSGAANYVAKWTAANTLGTGAIYDTGTNVSIGNIPATSYRFNVSNVSGTRFFSLWQPTIGSTDEIGILVHKGGGLFDQSPFAINASNIILSTGISTRVYITDTAILLGGTSGVSGGGTVQVAGNVNITGNFQVNGVTIGSGGGGVSYLFQLSDVTITSPANGQALVYNSSTGKWINSTISSGGGAVSSVFGRTGAVLAQDGDYVLNLLGDVVLSSPSNGQLLQYNGTNWVNATVSTSGGVNNLYQLLDVNIVSVANDQVLAYNSSTGKWQNKAFTAAPVSSVFGRTGAITAVDGDYTLNLLGDVTISSPSIGQILQYNGSAWVNTTNTVTGVSGSGVVNSIPKWTGTTTLGNSSIQDTGVGGSVTVSVPVYATSFFESSDLKLKDLLSLDTVKDLSSLVPISYTFKSDKENRVRFGYSAQDVSNLMKELCHNDINGYLSISYTDIHTLKIKQLEDRVEELEKQLNLR